MEIGYTRVPVSIFFTIMELKVTKEKVFEIVKKIVTNKYLLACTIALLWFLFLDSHTILDYYELRLQHNSIEKEIAYYRNLSKDSQEKMTQLESDMSSLEKFAREQFLMKRSDEDIFLFEEK